jgi:hypothetical protein
MTDVVMKIKKDHPSVYKILNESTGEYCLDEKGKENYAFTRNWAEYLLERYSKQNIKQSFKIVRIIKREL